MSRQKKKRNKKYRPGEVGPTIHRFVAETEDKAARRKLIKRRAILVIIGLLPLLLMAVWLL